MHLPRGQMVQQQPEVAAQDMAAVGRSQDAERGKKTRKFKCPSSSSCLLEFKCPAVCDGAEPDRGADSGQEPLQAREESEHRDHGEPPGAGQCQCGDLGQQRGQVSGQEHQAEEQTTLLSRPPAAGELRAEARYVVLSVIITRLT